MDCGFSETRNSYGTVSSPYWGEAFLIGGGPSLRGFDFELLRRRTTVAVNDAALHLPWATALFSLDQTWVSKREREIRAFAGEKFLAPPESLVGRIDGVTYLRRCHDPGLSTDPSSICLGGNSGYGALNLAYLKRAKRIVLLGFDLSTENGRNWHVGYQWNTSPRCHHFDGWARHFAEAAVILKREGVEVVNASADSVIDCFPKIPLKVLVEQLQGDYDG